MKYIRRVQVMCRHKRQLAFCKPCKGTQICRHQKQKSFCAQCNGHLVCISCRESQRNVRYGRVCARCYFEQNPRADRVRNLRMKEREVARYVKQVFAKQHSIVVDESVGPSRRRPDLLIKINALRVIVEVDERQHGSYDKTAEQQRVEDLKRDLNAPLVLIRFNPDAYRTAEGLQHGCFSLDRATKRLYVSNYAEWVERNNRERKRQRDRGDRERVQRSEVVLQQHKKQGDQLERVMRSHTAGAAQISEAMVLVFF